MSDNYTKFLHLREQYPVFVFDSFQISRSEEKLTIEFLFFVNEHIKFQPKITVPMRSFYKFETITEDKINLLAFNIGMIELISYWKATCSPTVIIKPFSLSNEQINWWKKLYFQGLGEFFYLNKMYQHHYTYLFPLQTSSYIFS